MMMKTLANAVLLACTSIAATAHADVLNLHYTAGDYSRDKCSHTQAGGGITRHPLSDDWCDIDIPIELPAGKTIRQISVFHGTTDVGDGYVLASLNYGDLNPPWSANYGGSLFDWSSSPEPPVLPSATGEGRLMRQFVLGGPKPITTFPDAFTTNGKRMYVVRVSTVGVGAFYGLRVYYL